MTKRSYSRRSDEEIINDLEDRIRQLEKRMVAKQRPDATLLREFPKVKKYLAKFSQTCMDNGRSDLANSILAFMTTFELQAKEIPEELKRSLSNS